MNGAARGRADGGGLPGAASRAGSVPDVTGGVGDAAEGPQGSDEKRPELVCSWEEIRLRSASVSRRCPALRIRAVQSGKPLSPCRKAHRGRTGHRSGTRAGEAGDLASREGRGSLERRAEQRALPAGPRCARGGARARLDPSLPELRVWSRRSAPPWRRYLAATRLGSGRRGGRDWGTGRGARAGETWKNHPDCFAVGEAAWQSRFSRAASPRVPSARLGEPGSARHGAPSGSPAGPEARRQAPPLQRKGLNSSETWPLQRWVLCWDPSFLQRLWT
ncbi:uncharacterized protein LOC110350317 [Heterocephalus glaber]|uniref:Uncharacterized protein LOC110350317 n=1 Tax=Heterocephalus glaber TaxID=10181 RepID=A0AAX6TCS7_HETGA|nr:uncharacterized protein LOC110350317 [Heterocephalus glaber]